MAVGNYTNTAGNVVTLAESWNGTAWTIGTTLNPAGATNTALAGVFCGSATDCTAVGRSFDAAGNQTAVVESWNGAAWKSQAAAVPAGATGAELSAVSCRSASACTAVGSYNNSSGTQVTLAESWNGTAWTVRTTPNPAGAIESQLNGVSCASGGTCTAVGYSAPSLFNQRALAEVKT
jgi:hypothetical protein